MHRLLKPGALVGFPHPCLAFTKTRPCTTKEGLAHQATAIPSTSTLSRWHSSKLIVNLEPDVHFFLSDGTPVAFDTRFKVRNTRFLSLGEIGCRTRTLLSLKLCYRTS